MKISVTPAELIIIKEILKKQLPATAKIWVFGSRANGTAKKTSDLDLMLDIGQPLTLKILANLHEEFIESSLPYKVDLVDWRSISDSFKAKIEKGMISLIL